MKKRNRMKNLLLAVCIAFVSVGMNAAELRAANYWPDGPDIETPCAIILEQETGTVLYEKMADEQHYPASITKIMTALLALENCSLDETVTFSSDAVYKTEGSSIWRDIGEEMTMEQCLYAMMLNSSNDCAYAIAEHVGGSYEHFVSMMNERAKELGCKNTHFVNPHGLPDPEHYTCCRDMALIARAAYQNENYRIITGTARYTIPPTNKHKDESTYLQNHNEMLHPFREAKYVYEYCTGGKTGWTPEAGYTLVTYAQKDGMTLVCVVMNTTVEARWNDSTNLFNYSFDNFQVWNVVENEKRFDGEVKNAGTLNVNSDYVEMDRDGVIVLPKTAEFDEAKPVVRDNGETTDGRSDMLSYTHAGDVVGRIRYTFAEREVGGADIVKTNADVETFQFTNQMQSTESDGAETKGKSIIHINLKKILLGILIAAAAVGVIFLLKKFSDNFYIIKHKLTSRNDKNLFRGKRYRTIKDSRKYKRRKRWKRWR